MKPKQQRRKRLFVGVDVAERRGCAWAALDDRLHGVAAGWVDAADTVEQTAEAVATAIGSVFGDSDLAIGIDAPRMPLARPRTVRWKANGWCATPPCTGRHCELVIASLRLANPQWTPTREQAPRWMLLGFALYDRLNRIGRTYEVFPSASYRLLEAVEVPRIAFDLRGFSRGPKDMLDAYIGALSVVEFVAGHGCEVGGGDGLGTIVLPRTCPPCPPGLVTWPATSPTG